MLKELNGKTYEVSDITAIKECCCNVDITLDPADDGPEAYRTQQVRFNINSDECWSGHEIEINRLAVSYEAQNNLYIEDEAAFCTMVEAAGYNTSNYPTLNAKQFLEELLGYDDYGLLTEDDYDGSGDNHAEKKQDALKEYIEDNNLTPYMDDERGFGNEWTMYLAPADWDISDILPDLYAISIDKAVEYSGIDYEYNCTSIREITWIDNEMEVATNDR